LFGSLVLLRGGPPGSRRDKASASVLRTPALQRADSRIDLWFSSANGRRASSDRCTFADPLDQTPRAVVASVITTTSEFSGKRCAQRSRQRLTAADSWNVMCFSSAKWPQNLWTGRGEDGGGVKTPPTRLGWRPSPSEKPKWLR
jgi:hypothetical protein